MKELDYMVTRTYNDDGSPPNTMIAPRKNFVAPDVSRETSKPIILPVQETAHTLNVPMQATQHIEMRTNAVDRSKGFLIANVPLFGALALGVWLLSGLLTTTPLFSFLGLCILWSSFVLAWLISYWYTLRVSAEGIAMYEAEAKWGVIREEQRRRWEHYDRLTGE